MVAGTLFLHGESSNLSAVGALTEELPTIVRGSSIARIDTQLSGPVPDIDGDEEHTTARIRFGTVLGDDTGEFRPVIPSLADPELRPGDTLTDQQFQLGSDQTQPLPGVHQLAMPAGAIVAGRYVLGKLLGKGGMGKVYEVTHARLGKRFALKFLHPRLAGDGELRRAFFREARFASSLEHPNIASVVDFGDDPTCGVYMVMEHVDGLSLETYSKARRPSLQRICDLALQVAEGIEYTHSHDIVHCDIKPRNLLVCERNEDNQRSIVVKLVDFGLARSRYQGRPDRLFGTPEYLAPELIRKDKPTPQSDIYALGTLLYELVTGSVPFRGTTTSIMNAQLEQVPKRPLRHGKPVAPPLESLIMKALSKDPSDRQQGMPVFLGQLRTVMRKLGYLEESSQSADQRTRKHTPPGLDVSAAHSIGDPQRLEIIRTTFDQFRLPIATLRRDGIIVAANAAFSRFLSGVIVRVEGSSFQETPLAKAWHTFEHDLAQACSGHAVGRLLELDLDSGTVCLQVWLEQSGMRDLVCLSLHPSEQHDSSRDLIG